MPQEAGKEPVTQTDACRKYISGDRFMWIKSIQFESKVSDLNRSPRLEVILVHSSMYYFIFAATETNC